MRVELAPWLARLRKAEVVDRVLTDCRSIDGTLLGVSVDAARNAIGKGQADFDQPYGDLTPDDLVLLYAYLNQLRHLEELTAVFSHIFSNTQPVDPVVVDIGCGPFTGGLAMAATLGARSRFDYIGVDRSQTMRRFGKVIADAVKNCSEVPEICTRWACDINAVPWTDPPKWRSVIVIVSYLFASPTLDPSALVDGLLTLLRRIGNGRVDILYTNSTKPMPNLSVGEFHERLTTNEFFQRADFEGTIEVERWSRRESYDFRCALWHRKPQRLFGTGTT